MINQKVQSALQRVVHGDVNSVKRRKDKSRCDKVQAGLACGAERCQIQKKAPPSKRKRLRPLKDSNQSQSGGHCAALSLYICSDSEIDVRESPKKEIGIF